MALDDLQLDRTHPVSSSAPTPPPSQPSPVRWIVLGAAAVIVGGVLTLWWLSRAQPGTAAPPATGATAATDVSIRPKRQNMDLPSLDDSDGFLRGLVATLSQHPALARLLATQSLIRNATLATVQIGDGKTPATPMAVLRPTARLSILGTASSGRIDPSSYARWDGDTAALVSIDPKDLAQLYVNVKVLFDQAYRELGHPSADFDEAIVRAIDTLRDTPTLDQDPVLLRKQPGFFEHEDQTMRGLMPVQKQFLLMGPDNRRRILAWLKQLATQLDLKHG
jgi:hypothetical protein